ncbi:MAG: hypothetical protein CMI56_00960 [Parcubacteria group bacterium]|nr:hypothetical protein [Parcubacteria group bacterium]
MPNSVIRSLLTLPSQEPDGGGSWRDTNVFRVSLTKKNVNVPNYAFPNRKFSYFDAPVPKAKKIFDNLGYTSELVRQGAAAFFLNSDEMYSFDNWKAGDRCTGVIKPSPFIAEASNRFEHSKAFSVTHILNTNEDSGLVEETGDSVARDRITLFGMPKNGSMSEYQRSQEVRDIWKMKKDALIAKMYKKVRG